MRVPRPQGTVTRPETALAGLCPVLSGLCFPVRTWHLMVAADDYGASAELRNRLRGLPDRRFQDAEDVAVALGTVIPTSHRRAGASA